LCGDVYDHERFKDDTFVNTSRLTTIDIVKKEAQTLNTLYVLGEPDPKFLEYLKKNGYKLEDYKLGE